MREEFGGNWYRTAGGQAEGWLCPALLRYFDGAPDALYVRAEPGQRENTADPSEVTALRNRIEELERLVYSLTLQNELFKIQDEPQLPPPDYPPRQWGL
jgi:hypothetical protein